MNFFRLEGIYVGEELNNGYWQQVSMFVNSSHISLASNNDTVYHPITQQPDTFSFNTFNTTVIGKISLFYQSFLTTILIRLI